MVQIACVINVLIFSIVDISDLKGIWHNEANDISIVVETINSGIKVKRTDQVLWYEYKQIRPNQYRDKEGNTYYFSDTILEWEDESGTRQIRFKKDKSAIDPKSSAAHSDLPRELSGHWINKSTGQKITVKDRGKGIIVQANDSDWVFFRPLDEDSFIDEDGNHYDYHDNTLSYRSQTGDFYMRFIQQ